MLAAAGKAARVNGDAWNDLLPALARHLLGDPPAIEAGGSWRYGKRGCRGRNLARQAHLGI